MIRRPKFISTARALTIPPGGGDIDLLVVSDWLGFRDSLRLRRRILDNIGWQQLDLMVQRKHQTGGPLAALAVTTGIKL